jgi:hypothetical protein
MAADCPRKSGKSQGRYPTPPVQTGHNTHDNLSLFCSICVVLTTYYEISDRLTLHPAGNVDKTSVKDCLLLCFYHHQIVIHRWGWTLVLNPDGTTTAWNPDKTKVLRSHSPPARPG